MQRLEHGERRQRARRQGIPIPFGQPDPFSPGPWFES